MLKKSKLQLGIYVVFRLLLDLTISDALSCSYYQPKPKIYSLENMTKLRYSFASDMSPSTPPYLHLALQSSASLAPSR